MKCSGKKEDGTPCDYTVEETFLFCPNCGSSCITEESEPPVDVITCPGKNKQCGAQIPSDSKANFCKECGWRIDRSLFCTPSKKCPGKNDDGSLCGGNITENDKFCLNCGQDFTSDEKGDKLGSHLTGEHDTQANAGAKIDHCSKEGVENEALFGKTTTDTKPDTTTPEVSESGIETQCGGSSTDTKPDTTITEVSEPGSGSLSGGSSTDTKPDTTITEVSEPGSGSLSGGSSTDTKPDTTITEVSEPGSGSLSGGSSTDTKPDTTITEVSEPGSGSLSGGSSTDTKPDTTITEVSEPGSGSLSGGSSTDTKPDTTTTEVSEPGSGSLSGGSSTDTKPDTTATEVSEPGSGSLSGGSSTDTKHDTTTTEVSEPGSETQCGESSTDTKPDTTITELFVTGKESQSGESSVDTHPGTTTTEVFTPGSETRSEGTSVDIQPDTTTKHEVKTGSQTQLGISADIQQSQINSENGEDNALQSGQVSHDGHVMSNEKQSGEGCENEDNSDNDESGSEEESESSDESGDDEVKNDKSTDQTTLSGDNAENQPSNSISNNPKQNQVSNESSMTVSSESEDTSSPKVKPLTLKQQSAAIEGNVIKSSASPQETFDVSPKMGECQHQVPVALGAASETTAPITTRDVSSKTEESSVNDDLTPAAVPSAISQGKENDNKDEEVSQKGKVKNGSKKKKTKKNKKKNVRGPKNKPTMTENESQVHHSQSKRKDDVDVIFHVIISSEFDFDPKSDKVSVAFQPIEPGGFENGWNMKPVRWEDDIREYSCQVHMSKEQRNKGFDYKYVVTTQDKKVTWENLYFGKVYTNRRFHMPGEMKRSKDSWHQYDGYVYPKMHESKLQSLLKIFRRAKDKFQQDVKVAARIFLPSHDTIMSTLAKTTPDETERAQNLVNTVQNVLNGLHHQISDEGRRSFNAEVLEDYVIPLLNQLNANSKMENHNKQGLLLGIFIVTIFHKNNVKLYLEKEHLKAMLIRPNREKKECPEMDYLEKHFPGKTECLIKMMEDLIFEQSRLLTYEGVEDADATWLYAVPFFHFLRKDSVPFVKNFEHNHNTTEWWGQRNLSREVARLKLYQYWSISIVTVIADLEHLFDVDFLLPRTIMACVSFPSLKKVVEQQKIPAEVSCATLYFYRHNNELYMVDCIMEVAKTFKQHRLDRRASDHCSRSLEKCFAERYLTLKITTDLITNCEYCTDEFISTAADLFASSVYECTFHGEEHAASKLNSGKGDEQILLLIEKCWKRIYIWMQKQFSVPNMRGRCLQCWNDLLQLDFGSHRSNDQWQTFLLNAVETLLSEMTQMDCLQVFITENISDLSSVLQERITNAAFTSFEDLVMRSNSRIEETTELNGNFGQLMSKLLTSHWPKTDDAEKIMKHILTWEPLLQYFKRFVINLKVNKVLTRDCTLHILNAAQHLDMLKISVNDGSIPVSQLRLIVADSDRFMELLAACACIDESKVLSSDDEDGANKSEHEEMQHILLIRLKELKVAEESLCQLKILMHYCVNITSVNTTALTDDISEMERHFESADALSSVCCTLPRKEAKMTTIDTYKPKLKHSVSEETMTIVPKLKTLKKSSIFHTIWKKEAANVIQGTSFEDSVKLTWQSASPKWEMLCSKIRDGTETFKNVQKHTKDLDSGEIKEEFNLMCDGSSPKAWVDRRLEQLDGYKQLECYQTTAKVIMDISKSYSFSGDFEPVRKISMLGRSDEHQMKKLDKNVQETCKILRGINDPNKQKCIRAYETCHALVEWLQTSMTGGVKELKVFVDLAYISAGEEPMEIHKVNCFHSATTGYAPLIFNTPQTADYATFLENCKAVLRELETDTKLPDKLIDANLHLTWLKEVKASHGSVEVTSLSQARMINSQGVYRIGNLLNIKNVSDLFLNNVISLHLSTDNVDTEMTLEQTQDNLSRKYSFDQLMDLQSRLMLVAGQADKGKENVDEFIMMLDGIVRLAKTYIRLCSDGCVLFECWKGEFMCGTDRKVCSVLEFGHDEASETLKGHCGKENVTDFVLALAKQFEDFHDEWMNCVSDKRDDYLELNFYTIEQLVFLQRELIKLGTEEEPSVRVYSMLSLIKPDCTQADLTDAMQTAKHVVFAQEEDSQQELSVEETLEKCDPKQAFINAMLDTNFSESLAKRALEAIGPDDVNSGVAWCFEHQEDFLGEDEVPEICDETFSGWEFEQHSFSSSASYWVKKTAIYTRNDVTVQDMTSNLRSVWDAFLEAVSSSVADYLSLEHLGIILRQLAQTDQRKFNRTIPLLQKAGIPNLIVCPQADMLNTVVYMYKHSEDEPLPQPDEVLLCTPQTTFDQVDIFLRRAFFSNPGKLYTMANADLLQYEIEERAEKKLKEYANRIEGLDYRLVILCSTENEFKARIVAALERQRCPPPPLQHLEDIRQYLQLKFSQKYEKGGMTSASGLDFESSTVRVIKSKRAGVGKTLYKKRQVEALQRLNPRVPATSVSIHLYEKSVSTMAVAEKLLDHTLQPGQVLPRIFHLDISYEVQEGVDYLLFNLLVLGCISNNMGHVWLKSPLDLYLVETIPITDVRQDRRASQHLIHTILEILPDVYCWSPQDTLQILTEDTIPKQFREHDSTFDQKEFESEAFQRPYQYLKRWGTKHNVSDIDPKEPERTQEDCLATLLQHCGVPDPAWSELHNFVWFLNTQLVDFESSIFCSDLILEDLPGFPVLVLHFLIQMSRDFATRSLVMSEEPPLDQLKVQEREEEDLTQFQMKRTWESSPHPYIFFNPDGQTMTFLGFNIDRWTGNMVDQQTGRVLERNLVPKPLQEALIRNRVNINENFDQMQRLERLAKLCSVMPGVDFVHDPDDTYELTTDNVKKILAIYMRFRCGIPVIIMGETGCGKTRLVKFMCALQCMPGSDIENMVIMKVHGGTTSDDIIKKVKHAEQLAIANKARNPHMYTVLFFDEANTTEAIGLIKEIMCDGCIDGQPLKLSENLKIVAACNPYRKHSDELIQRLEKAGLGYHVEADKTTDKLGHVPMRRLVYRVQPLPQSMLPLVWDFGQLNIQVEELYIRQMVNRYVRNGEIPNYPGLVEVISRILIASQEFMRKQQDECSFVSLRDVDRTLSVMAWFYQQSQENGTLFKMIDEQLCPEQISDDDDDDDDEDEEEEGEDTHEVEADDLWSMDDEMCFTVGQISQKVPDDLTKSLILALSVCYRASLRSRAEYDAYIVRSFGGPCLLQGGSEQFLNIIDSCQKVFVDEVEIDPEKNIAKNQALKENLFMMVVCIELRIPLFLVGKPGSSKSLAKTIVADAMQGTSAKKELFKQLKQAQMVSFQCSPLATAEGIVGTFRQCARYQQDKDLDRFVSIVVLDEVGLAEDSPRMPLKTLHSLLEDGYQGFEEPGQDVQSGQSPEEDEFEGDEDQGYDINDEHQTDKKQNNKVAFIGISNWALDPAKMNRGILVQREVPDKNELVESAEGICSSKKEVLNKIETLLPDLAEAYEAIFRESQQQSREFFGLRDFYSLVKMVYAFVATSKRNICWHQLEHAIQRNFGGLHTLNPVKIFKHEIKTIDVHEEVHTDDPDCSTIALLKAALSGDSTCSESRYLLLLTENYDALNILQQHLQADDYKHHVITIFGSSFPKDQEYTQVCRNINRIKVCMETGSTVILLNLENLYESLYDALNQYYAVLGGERFVDLGLGTHRVKCRVHRDFRLIVVAEKQIVYDKFPIPLINRLEKHFLTLNNMMTPQQMEMASRLHQWAEDFVTPQALIPGGKSIKETPHDAFMGYHPDTAAAIVQHVWGREEPTEPVVRELFMECKEMLLWCATPQYVLQLSRKKLYFEAETIQALYWRRQKHKDIFDYLAWALEQGTEHTIQVQVTTHSKLLTDQEKEDLSIHLSLPPNNIILLTLQSFDTEQQFAQQIKNFVQRSVEGQKLLLVQCGSGDRNQSLIRSAQYCVLDELHDARQFAVVFIIQLPNIAGGCFSGFQAGKWHSLHLDELTPQNKLLPTIDQLLERCPSDIFKGDRKDFPSQRMTGNSIAVATPNDKGENTTGRPKERSGENFMTVEKGPMLRSKDDIDEHTIAPHLQQLLISCIQSAAALIRDEERDTKRSTKRIEILLKLLNDKDDEDAVLFVHGVSKLVIRLLQEKESMSHGSPKNWLYTEAAKSENVQKSGTFRCSWIHCLESKITPILAQVLAFLDTSRNLDFMHAPDVAPWTKRLWLALLNNTTVCHDPCKRIITPGNPSQQSEVVPHHFGVSKLVFSVQMPFFWLLFHDIKNAILQAENNALEEDLLRCVENIISRTAYGKILLSVVTEKDKTEMIRAYLRDFVVAVYPDVTDKWKILCHALENAARQTERDLESLGVIQAVVYIHVIHSAAKERLHLFLEVVLVWPEVVTAVTDLKERVGGNPLLTDDEMTLDVLSLTLLMEQLEPSKDELNTDKGRSDWMDHVKTYLPVIGRILNTTETELEHGNVCLRVMDQARCNWMRVMTLKLFLESFTGIKKLELGTKYMPLWKWLGDDADLTKMSSLKKVDQFLKSINVAFEKKIAGKRGKCSYCETPFGEKLKAHLPCAHKICLKCFADIKAKRTMKCPNCQKQIPPSYKPCNSSAEQREVLEDYRVYQKCCNTFLMAVVSKLCFGQVDAPEDAVVKKVFSYITHETGHGKTYTKQMSVFEDVIDQTPVVRSFLLQLLIHKSEATVQEHLKDFFLHAKKLCQQGGEEMSQDINEIVQFSLLVIHCYEDLSHEQAASLCNSDEEMRIARLHLAEARQYIMVKELDIGKMFTVAKCRYGLSVAAKYLHGVLAQKSLHKTKQFNQLIQEVKDLLDVEDTDWPKKFLVKQICKDFGTDSYQAICASAEWLALDSTNEVAACPDRYVVCPISYQKLREAVAKTLLGQNIKHLKSLIKQNHEMLFLLALHREITMKNIAPSSEAQLLQKSSQCIEALIQNAKDNMKGKELALKLIKNEFGGPVSFLNITEGQCVRDQSLVCLLLHTYLVLALFNNKPGFLKPLSDLILHPENMKDKLFPTMPQDDTDSIREILLKSLRNTDTTVVVYTCPKGHPYVITECGHPVTEGRCDVCKEIVGGSEYKAFQGNTLHDGRDQTRPGHVLGRAADRTTAYAGERRLGGAACAVLRFFTHAALLLGAENNPQAVAALVYPQLQQDTSQFFLEHLQKDLQIIHLATGKSVDDVFLLLHFICHQISELDKYKRSDPANLTNKPARETWEDQFAKTFINQSVQNLEGCLGICNDRIRNDKRIGSNKLMSILYEVDTSTPQQVDCLHEFPAVWRYQSRITLEHFLREFHLRVENNKVKKSKMEVLSLFRQEHPFLQALHHIPNILRLQQLLMAKFRRRLDRSQANKMTIAEMFSREDEGFKKDVKELMPDLIAVWECVKESLHSHGCRTVHAGQVFLPDAYKNMRIEENSPLAMLLPSTQGPGICSYMMLEFLFRKHNEFMEKYCEKINSSYERLPEVSMRKLHSNHLVSYHPDRDLLPLVLANCNYSFELGKGTTIEYDFEGFEYQLKEVILQAKSRVAQISYVIPIDQMVYRADSGNIAVFKTLQDRIPQEPLSPAVKVQIVSELKSSLPDICDSINNLDITTSFLKSLGGDPDQSLQTFMTDVLKMKPTITSQKARQVCQFRHVQSLWLLLTFQKSVILAEHNQDPFSNLDSEHNVDLSEEERTNLRGFCQKKSPDKLEFFLQEIFNCLLLWVAVPADNSDGPSTKSMSLKDLLVGHLDRSLYSDEGVGSRSSSTDQTLTEDDIASLPSSIKGMHIPDTWLVLLQEINQRRKEM